MRLIGTTALPHVMSAQAKINLTLEITGRREDGYHLLSSVMQKIDLADSLTFKVINSIAPHHFVTTNDPACPKNEENIIFKAMEAWCRETGDSTAYHVHVEKRIPIEAGLGGGSSNAAAALRYLNDKADVNTRLSSDELTHLAARIGADVPFCLSGITSLCEGIGEIITPLAVLPAYRVILITGKTPVSTNKAFQQIDQVHDSKQIRHVDHKAILARIRRKQRQTTVSDANDFLVLQQACDDYQRFCQATAILKPLYAGLSGSGPTYFMILNDKDEQECARQCLACMFSPEQLILTALSKSV